MDIIQAIRDPNLFRSFLEGDNGSLKTWRGWIAALRMLYGLKVKNWKARSFLRKQTGRKVYSQPGGFDEALFLVGRRSGKSRIASLVGAYEAILSGQEHHLDAGERGLVAICAPSMAQGRVIRDYITSIFQLPLLAGEVERRLPTGLELKNGNRVEVLSGDWRTIRGFTLVAAIVDEAAFFGFSDDYRVRSDSELIRAIRPALVTTGGKLIAISSPHARKGWTWETFNRHYGKDKSPILVWNCGSRTMNPTLPQSVIDRALQEDYAAARSEYLGQFRDDVCIFLSRELIEKVVVKDRKELLPSSHRYLAFADVSGGRVDGSALAIAHRNGTKVILDAVYHWPSPHDPHRVIACQAEECRRYQIRRVVGDNYAAEFVASAFKGQGIRYDKSPQTASALYLELLPQITSKSVALLDNKLLIDQLSNLERRARAGGKDAITHPQNGHDDLANAVAGAITISAQKRSVVGALPS